MRLNEWEVSRTRSPSATTLGSSLISRRTYSVRGTISNQNNGSCCMTIPTLYNDRYCRRIDSHTSSQVGGAYTTWPQLNHTRLATTKTCDDNLLGPSWLPLPQHKSTPTCNLTQHDQEARPPNNFSINSETNLVCPEGDSSSDIPTPLFSCDYQLCLYMLNVILC